MWVMGSQTEIMKVPYEYIQGYLDYGGSVNGNKTHHVSPHSVEALFPLPPNPFLGDFIFPRYILRVDGSQENISASKT